MATTTAVPLNLPIGREDLPVTEDVGDEMIAGKVRVARDVKECREITGRAQQLESWGAEGMFPGGSAMTRLNGFRKAVPFLFEFRRYCVLVAVPGWKHHL